MAVYAPGDEDPMWSRLMGYIHGLSPIGSAQAGEAPNPDSPEARRAALAAAAAQLNGGGPVVPQPGVPDFPVSPEVIVPRRPLAGPATGPAGPIAPGGGIVGSAMPPSEQSAPPMPPWHPPGPMAPVPAPAPLGGPETRRMPYPGQIDPHGVFAPAQPGVTGAAVGTPPPVQGPFTQLDYRPNADVAGGALSRGGPPLMSALDLSGLFGGKAAAAPVAAPKKTVRVARPDSDVPLPPKRPKEKDTSVARARILRPDYYT